LQEMLIKIRSNIIPIFFIIDIFKNQKYHKKTFKY
jgi:hypothetical protein